MIPLTRLNGSRLFVNSDLIQWVEESPDSVITLVTGEKLVVAEPIDAVLRLLDEVRVAGRRGVPRAAAVVAFNAASQAAALADA